MPPVGFEPTISAGERLQTYALDLAATGIGKNMCVCVCMCVYVYIYIYIYNAPIMSLHMSVSSDIL